MRLLNLLFILIISNGLMAQDTAEKAKGTLAIKFENSAIKSMRVMQFNGFSFENLADVPVVDSMARIEIELSSTRFFYVGTDTRNMKPIILAPGADENMLLTQQNFRALRFDRNSLNGEYAVATKALRDINKKRDNLVKKWHTVKNQPAQVMSINQIFERIAADEKELRDSFATINPFLGSCYDLMTYTTFQVEPGTFNNELLHYINNRFVGIDFNDPNVYFNSWLYEAYKEFANLVSSYTITVEDHENAIKSQLFRATNPQAKIMAYAGILSALESKKHGNYAVFAENLLEEFPGLKPEIRDMISAKIKSMNAYRIGAEAPVFAQNDTEGNPISLEDFRGKVVLLDFWASWCGPCRRENPNVVKVYDQYKDKGFEILGISLDKDKNRWLGAIEKDKLTWPQVSDLKGWGNEVGKMYGVSSIPHTVLIDEEGNILALKLRGEALEKKLEEIFADK